LRRVVVLEVLSIAAGARVAEDGLRQSSMRLTARAGSESEASTPSAQFVTSPPAANAIAMPRMSALMGLSYKRTANGDEEAVFIPKG
jgi:hypothetical protein